MSAHTPVVKILAMDQMLQEIATKDLLADMAQRLAELERRLAAKTENWVAAYHKGDALRTDEAAYIANCSDQTVRRHADQAAKEGRPIGILIARSIWLIDLKLWLDDIERWDGHDARVAAEKRASRKPPLRASQPILARSVATTTGLTG